MRGDERVDLDHFIRIHDQSSRSYVSSYISRGKWFIDDNNCSLIPNDNSIMNWGARGIIRDIEDEKYIEVHVELYVASKMISIEGGQGYSGTLCSGLEITNSMKARMRLGWEYRAKSAHPGWEYRAKSTHPSTGSK